MEYYAWNFMVGMLLVPPIPPIQTPQSLKELRAGTAGNVASLIHVMLVLDYRKHSNGTNQGLIEYP